MAVSAERSAMIAKIRSLPQQLEETLRGLSDKQLDARPPGEWSPRQNVHHLADSHMNAFIRLKLALLEDQPTIKPYNQEDWAETPDGRDLPVEHSLSLLRGLHARWAALLESLSDADFARQWYHPEQGRFLTIDDLLVTYSNHGEGHIKQINEALAATA